MIKRKGKVILASLAVLSLIGCAQVFNGVVLENRCKKCEVIDSFGKSIWQEEGCGSSNTNIEEHAKVAAYDLTRGVGICNVEVRCETWKNEED